MRTIQFPGMTTLYNAMKRNFGLNFYQAGILRIEKPIMLFGREVRKDHVDALMALLGEPEPAREKPAAQSAAVPESEAEEAEADPREDADVEVAGLFGGAPIPAGKPGRKGR
jgi:hypothetical protein